MSKNGKPNTWNSRFFINYIRFATSKSNMNLKLNKLLYMSNLKSKDLRVSYLNVTNYFLDFWDWRVHRCRYQLRHGDQGN